MEQLLAEFGCIEKEGLCLPMQETWSGKISHVLRGTRFPGPQLLSTLAACVPADGDYLVGEWTSWEQCP